jgi:4'-phosphopantetheinyl transferase
LRLDRGAVHVWQADLDAAGEGFGELLDRREWERAQRIARQPSRRRWVAARGLLRALLGGYLEEDPSALRLAQEGHGKPVLDLPGGSRLRFNLSHSGALAVYAVTELCPIGVDVELVERRIDAQASPARPPDEVALAERVLGSATAEHLRTLDPPVRRREFLRAWVRHEAEGKRLGTGVRNAPDRAQAGSSRPWIADLELGCGAVGAVALGIPPVDFRVYAIDFRGCGSILPAATNNP